MKMKWAIIGGVACYTLGFAIGMVAISGEAETTEVERIVEVEKIIEVESEQCKKDGHNLKICSDMLGLSGQANGIAGGILQNLEVYIAFPEKMTPEIEKIEQINERMKVLTGMIR